MSLFSGFRQDVKSRNMGRLLLLSVLVGVVAGYGALAFNYILNLSDNIFMDQAAGYHLPSPGGEEGVAAMPAPPKRRWLLLVLPATGALMGSLLSYKFAPEARGEGTDSVIAAFHRGEGVIRARIPF